MRTLAPFKRRILFRRDEWFRGAPDRWLEVFANWPRTRWSIRLLEGGRVVAFGEGGNWLVALAAALRSASRKT